MIERRGIKGRSTAGVALSMMLSGQSGGSRVEDEFEVDVEVEIEVG
jgi:hypothetical protein